MNIKDRIQTTIVDLSHEGFGVAKVDNLAIFIPYALVGEEVICEIMKVDKNFCTARLIEVLKTSSERVKPICKIFYQCGGCELMHMRYEAQLQFKQKMVKETFKRLGGIEIDAPEILGMDEPYYYRNKIQVPYGTVKDKVIAGYYKKKSHDIIPFDECFIQPKEATEIVKFIRNLANEFKISSYDEAKKKGCLRHVLIRTNKVGQIMVVLITNEEKIPSIDQVVEKLTSRYPNIVSVIHNINSSHTNVILGRKHRLLFGVEELVDQIDELKFKISHQSFFQVNREQTVKLYRKVVEYLEPTKDDIVVDGYCGVGTISLTIAPHVAKVYGIETVKDAIEDAKLNASFNQIENAEFYVGKVEDEIDRLLVDHKVTAIVLDPPRKGVESSVLDAIAATTIQKLVYVSCNVATLARDVSRLKDSFTMKRLTLVDMFPQTSGVEAVCLLERLI